MAIQKMTFRLDTLTAARINALSRDLGKTRSAIVREAVSVYARTKGKVTEEERIERVRLFRELVAKIPPRPRDEVDAELRELRLARRGGGRGTPVES